MHEAIHHQIVRLYYRWVNDGSKLLLRVWVHLHLTRGKPSAGVPLMLLAAGLGAGGALFLGCCRIHVVRPPRILIVAGGLYDCFVGSNILNLTRSDALCSRVDLVGHARAVQRVLVFRVLRRPVLTQSTIAFSVVLDRHVHPVLHFQFGLLLLQLALIPDMVRAS